MTKAKMFSLNNNPDMLRICNEMSAELSIPISPFTIKSIFTSVVIVSPSPSAINLILALICKMLGKTFVVGIHDPEGHDTSDKFKVWMYNYAMSRLAHHIIFFSHFSKEMFASKFGTVDCSIYYFGKNYNESSVVKLERSVDILMFGRFRGYSGYERLSILAAKYPSLKILIIGRSAPKFSGHSNVVSINKFVSDKELFDAISNSKFVCLPYYSASQSGAIPLAIAFGAQIIHTDVGGLAEQLLGIPSIKATFVESGQLNLSHDLSEFDMSYKYSEWRARAIDMQNLDALRAIIASSEI